MAVVTGVFLDTSILLGGLIELGPSGEAAQKLMSAIARQKVGRCSTAWHCCLEFYSVATRLPAEYRLVPRDALRLLADEVLGRLTVYDLPARRRLAMLRDAVEDRVGGGRIYDVHIAETARAAGADIVVTDNRRHFVGLLRHGVSVLTAVECLERIER